MAVLMAERLTQREQIVLALIAAGLTDRRVAWRLCISPSTVDFHVRAILAKLEATSRANAVHLAHEAGYDLDEALHYVNS